MIGIILFIKFFPAGKLSFLNNDNLISQVLCSYPVTMVGERMEPFISANSNIVFNKCFETEDLKEGSIIIYRDDNTKRLGIIRYIQDYGKVIYKVSTELEPQNLIDVEENQIIGITDIDTSETKYIPIEEDDELLELSDYVSELYLGIIPISQGIENSVVEEVNQFDLEKINFVLLFILKRNYLMLILKFLKKFSIYNIK